MTGTSMKNLFAAILCTLSVICSGQPLPMEEELAGRFAPSDSIHWMTTYAGLWNDFHPVEVILSFNGTAYHGAFRYEKSGLMFNLVGEVLENGQAFLFEVDATSRHTAVISGTVTDVRIDGQWIHQQNDQVYNFNALAADVIPLQKFTPEACSYAANPSSAGMVMMKEAPKQLSGIIYTGDPGAVQFISGLCGDVPCHRWTGDVLDAAGLRGTLEAEMTDPGKLDVTYLDLAGKETLFPMEEVFHAPMEVRSYAGYAGSIDLSFMELNARIFREWINGETDQWWQEALNKIGRFVPEESMLSERQHLVWSGWIEPGNLDRKLVTGVLTLTGPDKSGSIPFTIDLERGMMVPVESLFRKNTDLVDLISSFAERHRSSLFTEDEEAYNAWLSDVPFKHICFRPDGMAVLTDFSPVFGVAEIVIPYADLGKNLRRKSILTHLIDP